MRADEAIVDLFEAHGVETVFSLASEEIITLLSEIEDERDDAFRVIHCRHEQGAAAMADGYARASGGIGVCVVGRGPAIAQTGTSLVTASKHGSRVLYLVPESRRTTTHDGKGFRQGDFLDTMVGDVESIRSPDILLSVLADAFRRLRAGEGPIAVQVPTDVLEADLSDPEIPEPDGSDVGTQDARIAPDEAAVEAAIDAYLDSDATKAPVIVAGRGAMAADARDAIERLAERMNAYLVTTLQAKGYFADHPFYLGFAGDLGSPLANEYVIEADFILGFGASLNHHTVDSGELVREDAKIVHVDTDPAHVDRFTDVDVGIVGDAKTTAAALHDELEAIGVDRAGEFWTDRMRRRVAEHSSLSERDFAETPGTVDPRDLVRSLDDALPDGKLVVTDVGHHLGWVFDGLTYGPDDRQIWSADFLALGQGLPMGVGAALGQDERTTVVFCGDGALMMILQELETAARVDAPLIVVVVNDDGMGAEAHMGEVRGHSGEVGDVPAPDLAALAATFGAEAHTIRATEDVEDLASTLRADRDGPLVLDCRVNPNAVHRTIGNMDIE